MWSCISIHFERYCSMVQFQLGANYIPSEKNLASNDKLKMLGSWTYTREGRVQMSSQVDHHGTRNRRIGGSNKFEFHELGVVVTGEG